MAYAPSICGIYAITQISTGRRYIGSAINTKKRWGTHRWHLQDGSHHCRFLQAAWQKYGESDFEFSILEEVSDPSALLEREIAWLATTPRAFNSQRPRTEERVWTGMKHSPLTIKRMKRIHKELNKSPELRAKKTAANRRNNQTPEARARAKQEIEDRLKNNPDFTSKWLRDKWTGRHHTPEARAKMRAAAIKRPPQSEETRRKKAEAMRGRKPSEETRRKLSEANKRWVRGPEMRTNMSRGQRERAERGGFSRGAGGKFTKAE